MNITRYDRGQVTVFVLSGRLDAYAASHVRQSLVRTIEQGRTQLVVDLGAVALIDSGGLGALVTAMKHARQLQGDLRLAAMPANVRVIFDVTRLDHAFQILDNVEAAIATFAQ